MDHIHSSEEDDDNDGKRHKLTLIQDRKQIERNSSLDDDEESSRDSIQLQIVDDRCEAPDEASAPVLPVKSAPVMQFIDHHGLDLLVDSIEEFAAREEESNTSTAEPVDGLQLLSALAEQRSREERGGQDGSPLRRHSADCSNYANINSNHLSQVKRKQRSESCFATNPVVYDENEELLSDIKKMMKTSSCQTDSFDRRRRHSGRCDDELASNFNLRRSERIFIHDSVVVNSKDTKDVDVNKDKEVVNSKDLKKKDPEFKHKFFKSKDHVNNTNEESNTIKSKDNVSIKNKSIIANDLNTKSSAELISHPIPTINKNKNEDKVIIGDKVDNQRTVFDLSNSTKEKSVKKDKKKLSSLSESFSTSFSSTCESSDDLKQKKRKKKHSEESKKKLKSDSEKLNNISKKVTEIAPKEDSNIADESTVVSDKITSNENTEKSDNNTNEKLEAIKKKKQIIKAPFELYSEKRMRLLDETIDEIISKQSISPKTNDILQKIQTPSVTETEPTLTPMQSAPQPSTPSKLTQQSLPEEPEKPEKPEKQQSLVKQASTESSTSSSSDSSSVSSINLRLTESDLDLKMNVIMLVDGLLFVGEICPIQAPDIYGIILHGERQHRPHIYSQEEMLREAIREVSI